ncbi:MAG: hypothetical protein JXQ73_26760 [Phycisphaerae bacterium]|nr:hypothetical protein [Phycisphaerae bacterium]
MAKKSIGIVEQHVEKVILGIAVLFLLAVVVTKLISSPNTVEYDGETYGPGGIDRVVAENAKKLAGKLARKDDDPNERLKDPGWKEKLEATFLEGQIAVNRLDPTLVAAVAWGRPAKRIERTEIREFKEGIALAKVEAPGEPNVQVLRTLAAPPKAPAAEGERPAAQADVIEEDINLVIIESEFDRVGQIELLKEGGYDEDMTEVVFADVQVQRQERFGAEWGEWEDIVPYNESALPKQPKLILVGEGENKTLSRESMAEFGEYYDRLRSENVQRDVLTPLGPTRRNGQPAYQGGGKDAGRASVRATPAAVQDRKGGISLKGLPKSVLKRDARDYGKDSPAPRRTGATEAKSGTRTFRTTAEAAEYFNELLAKAKTAHEARNYEEAKKLAQEALDVHKANRVASISDERLLGEILGLTETGRPGKGPGEVVAKDRFSPIRAFDISGEPGRTYRYRTRVGIVNAYCRAAAKLKDRDDATKLVLYGDWSDPSEAVSIERDTYFYLVGKDPRGDGVRVEIFKWYQDGWIKELFTITPGDEIGGTRDAQVTIAGQEFREEVDFFTGALAVDLSIEAIYQPAQTLGEGKGFALSPSTRETQSLIYMDEDGELHERFALVDKNDPRYKDLYNQTRASRAKPVKVEASKKTGQKSSKSSKFSRYKGGKSKSSRYGGSRSSRSSSRGRSRSRR